MNDRADYTLDVADLTGDGIADIVWGASDPGTIVVFAGPMDSFDPSATAPDGWWVNGGYREGTWAVAGDLDGDGIEDLVQSVRDPDWGDDWDDELGELTVIPGPLLGAPDCIVTLSGPSLGHPIGPVAGVGDPDGDGDGDFAFVSWSPLYLLDLAHAASAPYELPGWQQATTQDWLVRSMNSVGDLDGDGIVELAAHDAAAGSTGSIRLISVDAVASGDPAFSQVALTPPVNAWEIILQGGGDADGDGRTDLLVGERTLGGTVCVLTEVPPPGVHALATVGSCWATLPPDQIAWDVSWMPDLDGDGLDEVAASLALSLAGPPTLRVDEREIAVLPALGVDGPDDARIHLPFADLQLGYLAVGDVSGDGLADIVYGGGLILGENLTP